MAINIGVFLFITFPATRTKVDLTDPLLLEYLRSLVCIGRISAREVLQHLSAHDLLVFQYGFRPAAASMPTLLQFPVSARGIDASGRQYDVSFYFR
jgi:hypothetical protein